MKRNEYGTGFADTFLQRADQFFSATKLRLELAAARQRHDRALLALGEETYAWFEANRGKLPIELERIFEMVTNNIEDCKRIQDRIDELKSEPEE